MTQRESVCVHDLWSQSAPGIEVCELPPARVDMLRLHRPDDACLRRVGTAIGVSLEGEANTARGDGPRAIWMGPGEWMIVGSAIDAATLEQACEGTTSLVVPVGHGRYPLEVRGLSARDLLAKAISLDLHRKVFAVGATAMTIFAQVPVMIDHPEDDVFVLWFDISFKFYVRTWVEDGLREFAVRGEG
jgi:sarcosine oxidase, subunit gamma